MKTPFASALGIACWLAILLGGCGGGADAKGDSDPNQASGASESHQLAGTTENEDETFGIVNGKTPEEGVIFGGQPTEDQLTALAEHYASVINLRMPAEDAGFSEEELANELGVTYAALSVNAAALADSETYDRFFDLFEQAERPVLVHCASGNRVGALYYAYLVARRGVEPAEALRLAQENGLRSEALGEAVTLYLETRPPDGGDS